MAANPEAIRILIDWAARLGLPAVLMIAGHYLESQFNLDARGDSGRAIGGIQMRTDVWGGDADTWSGVAGLDRSLAVITAQQWAWSADWGAVAGWEQMTEAGQVAALMRFWQTAQRSSAISHSRAADALQIAADTLAAWEAQQGGGGSMAVVKPVIDLWKPAHPDNYTTDRTKIIGGVKTLIKWEAIAVHTTDGGTTIEDLAGWFGQQQRDNKGNRVYSSTPFGIGQDGRLLQCVSLINRAFAHGIVNKPTAQIVIDNAGIDPNYWAIGIELLDGGIPGSHTPAQLDKLAWLCAWLAQDVLIPEAGSTGFTVSRERVIGHYQIDGVDRAFCPSWPEARYTWLIGEITKRLAAGPVEPPPVDQYAVRLRRELAGVVAAADDDVIVYTRQRDALIALADANLSEALTRAAVRRQDAAGKLTELEIQ